MGLSRRDFLEMTPAEFEAAATAWRATEESRDRAQWLRIRRLAAILIRPHVKKAIPEEKLIPLRGDRSTPPVKKMRRAATSEEVAARRIDAFRRSLS